MSISCHFRDCKALLVMSLIYVSGAIANVQTFTFMRNKANKWNNYLLNTLTKELSTRRTLSYSLDALILQF